MFQKVKNNFQLRKSSQVALKKSMQEWRFKGNVKSIIQNISPLSDYIMNVRTKITQAFNLEEFCFIQIFTRCYKQDTGLKRQ